MPREAGSLGEMASWGYVTDACYGLPQVHQAVSSEQVNMPACELCEKNTSGCGL